MTCDDAQLHLDDYVEGRLAGPDRSAVEDHLAGCAVCREEAGALRALLEEAAALPRSIPPQRDLWPEIAQRVRATKVVAMPLRRRAIAHRWLLGAVAAVIVAAVSSAVTAILLQRRFAAPPVATQPAPPAPPAPPADLAGAPPWEPDYLAAMGELLGTLQEVRGSLPREAVALIEENLRVIDGAIRESRAAWARDPQNRALGEMLSASYRRKLEFLQQAARLSSRL